MAFEAASLSLSLVLLLTALALSLPGLRQGVRTRASLRQNPLNWMKGGVIGLTIAASGLAAPGSWLAVAESGLAIAAGGLALLGGVQLFRGFQRAEG